MHVVTECRSLQAYLPLLYVRSGIPVPKCYVHRISADDVCVREAVQADEVRRATLDECMRHLFESSHVHMTILPGNHLFDVLVENDEVAARFIEGLRRYNLGRATFVPLNRLQPMPDAEVPQGWVAVADSPRAHVSSARSDNTNAAMAPSAPAIALPRLTLPRLFLPTPALAPSLAASALPPTHQHCQGRPRCARV